MHVLITGAGGHLGRKLFDFLEASDHFSVSGLDIRPVDHPNIHLADLSGPPSWVKHLGGVDVIVHLAGDREPTASWKSSVKNNMDATLSLYHHAAAAGVSRVVLASSNWIHGDKRFTNDPLNEETPPGPINAYGMSKLFCERTGAYFAEHQNLSVICLRIGWTQWTHDNQPGTHMAKAADIMYTQPVNMNERAKVAIDWRNAYNFESPIVLDWPDNRINEDYAGSPERLYVLDAEGVVTFKSEQGPNYDSHLDDWGAALEKIATEK